MKIRFAVQASIYSCNIQITDTQGTRTFIVDALEENENGMTLLSLDIENGEFDLTVTPIMADYKSALNKIEAKDWKEKAGKKLGNVLFKALENTLLRVGCRYHITNIEEGDVIDVASQEYILGQFDKFDLFELIPIAYMFYEVSCSNRRFELTSAYETNRKDVVSSAKKLTLIDFGLKLIFTYPFQVGRIKRLTSNKRILKTLKKFNNMNCEERERFISKKEKFLSDY